MVMTMATVRSRLLIGDAGRVVSRSSISLLKRDFSSSAHQNDDNEAKKWEKITYAGIGLCTVLALYNLSKGHPHYEEPPPYPYLRIRNKEFPWGPDGLFEKKKH